MTTTEIARSLGRRGGQARSKRLTNLEKRRIASIGAAARVRSLRLARRIAANFGYAAAVRSLAARDPRVERLRTCHDRLPGLYRDGS